MCVSSLFERNLAIARQIPARQMTAGETAPILRGNASRDGRLMTGKPRYYLAVGRKFAVNDRMLHARGKCVREDVYIDTIKGFLSVFKRGMRDVYQHCGE